MAQLLAKITRTMATSCYFDWDVWLFLAGKKAFSASIHSITNGHSGIRAMMIEQCD